MSAQSGASSSIFNSIASWWGSTAPQPAPASQNENQPSPPATESNTAKRARLAKNKVDQFEATLDSPKVNLRLLQDLCTKGIPDKPGMRQKCWLLLLGVLPLQKSEWKATLEKNEQLWLGFVQELVINPRDEYNASQRAQGIDPLAVETGASDAIGASGPSLSGGPGFEDHPLSLDRKSTWNAYFKDCELQAEIKKDVSRTFPTLHFFREGRAAHLESLERILFIWCKLNPGVSYVQGMNEVLGPLYYLFAISPENEGKRSLAESQAFFCFMNLMSEIMNNFIKTLDGTDIGIVHQIEQLSRLLQEKDPQLWKDLENKKLNLQFFAFRQLTLLLSQEFELPDVLRLWDTLFSDTNRFELLKYCCCSMLMLQREYILRGDFAENLKLMQSYPPSDIEEIISYAIELATDTEFEPPFSDLDEIRESRALQEAANNANLASLHP